MSAQRFAQDLVRNLRSNLRNMMSHNDSEGFKPSKRIDNSKTPATSYIGVKHVPDLPSLKAENKICDVLPLSIAVEGRRGGGKVPGFLHLPQGYAAAPKNRVSTAAILLSGAGGGVVGPSSIYLSMGDKLASLRQGIPVLRLDYRFPASNEPCCHDVVSAMDYLRDKYQISAFVLVGWSFGSAPVFTVAASDHAVAGCATIAGQTAYTDGVRLLSPRPLLLLHGTADKVLSPHCAETIYNNYGSRGTRKLHLFEADDHALTKHSLLAEEMLCDFVAKCADVPINHHEQESVIKQRLIDDSKKVELMKKGGDLRGQESIN